MKFPVQLFLTLLLIILFVSDVQAEDDWGSSYNLLLKKAINEEWFMLSRSNLATRRDNEQLFLGYTGASLGYNLNKEWSVRAGYRIARFRIGESWRTERRPMVEAYYGNMYDGWRLTSRSRIEFRQPDWRENDVRLRQEFTATAPFKLTLLEMQPFVENEIFYSTRNDWIEANWATIGLSFFPIDNTKVKAGYRHNHIRIQGDFITRHTLVIGVNLFY
ncbi:MAG: DUF2490 domain-containing protein [Gammaproteobacteria bacterium]|nr:DUF2490 domain-containing protein [Gammaproteobacteria bacterium]